MAKLKTDTPVVEPTASNGEIVPEKDGTREPQSQSAPTSHTQPVATPVGGQTDPPATEEPEPKPEPEPGAELPIVATGILKIYPGYDELYIDQYGGAYTVNTREEIRGNAVHYINPFKK